jgi:hypothetical protein
MDKNEKYWTDEANALLKGRRIAGARYLTATETEGSHGTPGAL